MTYALIDSPDSVFFAVDSATGDITNLFPLDADKTKDSFFIQVTAFDNEMEADFPADVTIQVRDINDNAPIFNVSVYTVRVDENTPVNTSIVTTRATDRDKLVNGQIRYSITGGDGLGMFTILQSSSGVVSLAGVPDFETKRSYNITVRAQDSGTLCSFLPNFAISSACKSIPLDF